MPAAPRPPLTAVFGVLLLVALLALPQPAAGAGIAGDLPALDGFEPPAGASSAGDSSAGASSAGAAGVPAHHPSTLLVGFEPAAAPAERAAAHAAQGAVLARRISDLDVDVVRLPPGADPVVAAARYAALPGVDFAHPNWLVRLLAEPDDSRFPEQWGLHNVGQPPPGANDPGTPDADIDGPEGWKLAFAGTGYPSSGGRRIGVLDTGVDRDHPDLRGKTRTCASATIGVGLVLDGTCMDDHLHGTHVAGIAAAITDNTEGVAGVAPNAELAAFKALNAVGSGFYADIVAGIQWLADPAKGGAHVINMSFGGPRNASMDRALTDAYRKGVLLVAAAGNDGDGRLTYPAAHPDVISVAATDNLDRRAAFSNCNGSVELAAPGVSIWSTVPRGAYLALSGTSMATPHVSGIAAMLMWLRDLGHEQTRSRLGGTADDLGPAGRDACFGHGRVNLAAALRGQEAREGSVLDVLHGLVPGE